MKTFASFALAGLTSAISIQQRSADFFAQVAAEASHTCQSTPLRNKASLVDFWGVYNGSQTGYTDMDFYHDNDALFWSDSASEAAGDIATDTVNRIEWKRVSNLPSDEFTLFGSGGVSAKDVIQGELGNCWFMSACAAIAEFPERVQNIFLGDGQISENGIYGINIYALGVPHNIIIDDWMPMNKNASKPQGIFANVGADGSVWAIILEKAFAKYHGNYHHIIGGVPAYSVRTLTGGPYASYAHNGTSMEKLWEVLSTADADKDIMQSGTPGGGNHDVKHENGLSHTHAYTVIGVTTLSTGQRLVKLRNPWGEEGYKGPWCDSCAEWTSQSKAEVGLEETKADGVFHMSIEDFHLDFSKTDINQDVTGWNHAYFLKIGDDSQSENPGEDWTIWGGENYCGPSCTQHILTLKSDVAQEVIVTGWTWDPRGMAKECKDFNKPMQNGIRIGNGITHTFAYGDKQLDPIQMSAGEEVEITYNLNFVDSEVSKDWSVTAWGKDGALSITHKKGYTSDTPNHLDSYGSGSSTSTNNSAAPILITEAAEPEDALPDVNNMANWTEAEWYTYLTAMGW